MQKYRLRFLLIFSLVSILVSCPSFAGGACADLDDAFAVANGNLGANGAYDTLFKLNQCDNTKGASGNNPPVENINPDLAVNGYSLVSPNPNHDYSFRFVPLCANGSGDHEYTLGSLEGTPPSCPPTEYVRCADGTRPLYYADQSVEGPENAQVDIISNNWLFYVEGGSSCSREINRGDEFPTPLNIDLDQGEMCWIQYNQEMAQATTNGAPRSRDLGGIMNSDQVDNPFRGYNRVTIARCSHDLWLGDKAPYATSTDSDNFGVPVAGARSYTLFRQGRRIFEAVFADLADGAARFPANDGGMEVSLTPLSAADSIVLSGNSNGAFGLIHGGDRLASFLTGNVAPTANIRLVLDNRYKPSLENEAAFNNNALACNGVPGDCTMYDRILEGISNYQVIGSYSELQYQPNSGPGVNDGKERARLDSWGDSSGDILDQSCISTHAGNNDAWRCYDLGHVLAHHVASPFFIHAALNDVALRTHPTDWSDDPIGHEWTPSTYRQRMIRQLSDFLDERATRGDEGLDNANWSLAVFAPYSSQHVAIVDDAEVFGVCLEDGISGEPHTYASALENWVEHDNPAAGMVAAFNLIEGSVRHPAVRCDGLIFRNGFESADP